VFVIELRSAVIAAGAPAAEAGEAVAATDVDANEAAVPTLLYVEDNPANLKLVEEMVRFRTDVQLLSAPDARLGIELARAHRPRAILMDLHLPGMSGEDALKVLREDRRTADIPVIAITADAMPRAVARGLATGFFRYLTKPLILDAFTEAVDSALAATQGQPAGDRMDDT
jgi:CheY-like chemotaxis protein